MATEHLSELLQQIVDKPLASLSVVVNLIIIESLLSVDNAAVLATMVLDLPKDQRRKALRYGILGAYFFRGICLLFAALLIRVWWFKPLGGLYLLMLAIKHFFFSRKNKEITPHDETDEAKTTWLYRNTQKLFGHFWGTVILVELMDLAFSIDNVIAANAYTKNIVLVWVGVFIGILAMRFVAQGFVRLMERYTFLDTCAYLVIGILGIKLSMSLFVHFRPESAISVFLEGNPADMKEGEHPIIWGDLLTSLLSIVIFVLPIVTSVLFNIPKKHAIKED